MAGGALAWLILAPALGALALSAFPPGSKSAQRGAATAISLIPLVISLALWAGFDVSSTGFQFIERAAWIPRFGISWFLGIDGISLLLVLLTTVLTPLVLYAATQSIHKRLKAYLVSMLLLESAMLGTLVALDLVLFYVFWELMLVPMFLIIGVWGGERRVYAALKFVLFTMVGSLPMLAAILYLGLHQGQVAGDMSFALTDLYASRVSGTAQHWLFLAFALAFAIKVPMWPLHTWLPDAHVEAPTGGSVILAGVLLKMGTYGFVRFVLPLFPDAVIAWAPWIGALAVIGIVYGALVAMVQPDMKKLVAYSSVSHLGFVMLGIASMNAIGLTGAVFQMVAHGLSTGALFLLVGVVYERRHTRLISEYGGLWKQVPNYAVFFLVVMLGSVGLPGLCGFVGEFLILIGAFHWSPALAAVGVTGVVLGAAYMLRMYQRVMFGELDSRKNGELEDVTRGEVAVLAPLLALIVLLGVYPKPFLDMVETSVETTLERAGFASTVSPHVAALTSLHSAACEAVPEEGGQQSGSCGERAEGASVGYDEHAALTGAQR
jgi:NADH-quinone oxidoreductase subunit M